VGLPTSSGRTAPGRAESGNPTGPASPKTGYDSKAISHAPAMPRGQCPESCRGKFSFIFGKLTRSGHGIRTRHCPPEPNPPNDPPLRSRTIAGSAPNGQRKPPRQFRRNSVLSLEIHCLFDNARGTAPAFCSATSKHAWCGVSDDIISAPSQLRALSFTACSRAPQVRAGYGG
jgi:hypothetical protein